ncbi:MAG: hypothetical protein KJ699_06045, partial [Alphaproteobacteria bacterium]|nr:hypothetical protein [Alphaproteobacteria bacterium]MBU1572738.1 hypothetical protein [Alphaproteobacteria bacterium]
MSAQSTVELAKLYSGKLLALAADIPLTGRLETPQASVRERAPLCGSTVTVDLDGSSSYAIAPGAAIINHAW